MFASHGYISCEPMCSLESLKIDLKALKEDETVFDFKLSDDYFAAIDAEDVRRGRVVVRLVVRRTTDCYFELDFTIKGTVVVSCDRCLDDMEQPIDTENRLVAKLGEEYSEEDDTVTVDEKEGMLDTSWFIYETIALSIPMKHVHQLGECNDAMTALIEQHSTNRSGDGVDDEEVDSRWSELKKLKEQY